MEKTEIKTKDVFSRALSCREIFFLWSLDVLLACLGSCQAVAELTLNQMALSKYFIQQPCNCMGDGPGFEPLINRTVIRRANHSAMGPRRFPE